MMLVFIPRKQGGSGSIRDLASDHYDRVIKFRKDCLFAVVEAAHFGGYTTHRSAEAAISASIKSDCSHAIIDRDGFILEVNHRDQLVRTGGRVN